MVADYAGTGVTVGRHPDGPLPPRMRMLQLFRAGDLRLVRHSVKARIARQVIARQRPGTAHGFILLSLEDETGIANAIGDPDPMMPIGRLSPMQSSSCSRALQNIDKVVHLRARHIEELQITAAPMVSHDSH